MAIFKHTNTLQRAIADWQTRNLISPDIAAVLSADVETRRTNLPFTRILLVMGVICLAFAAMTFVASNLGFWSDMPRIARMAVLILGLWASWGVSIWSRIKGHPWIAEAFVLLAACLFGAAIMLISQMYQIQGNAASGVLFWAYGAFISAIAARSRPTLVLTIGLFMLWFGLYNDSNWLSDFRDGPNIQALIYLILCAAAAYWMRSKLCGHLCLIAIISWYVLLISNTQGLNAQSTSAFGLQLCIPLAIVVSTLAGMLLIPNRVLAGFNKVIILYCAFSIFMLLFIWYLATDISYLGVRRQVAIPSLPLVFGLIASAALTFIGYTKKAANLYDLIVCAVFMAILTVLSFATERIPFTFEVLFVATSIWVTRMGWRLEYRALSALGMLGFAGTMLLIYAETVGTLLGTAAFYLVAGILLVAGTLIATKFSKGAEQ